jgi:hypothetical protein
MSPSPSYLNHPPQNLQIPPQTQRYSLLSLCVHNTWLLPYSQHSLLLRMINKHGLETAISHRYGTLYINYGDAVNIGND